MPDVVGSRLDAALSDLERAGVKDDAEVLGGGTFGVIDESNWEVCEQLPAAGQAVTDTPRLTVERTCPETSQAAGPSSESPTTEGTPEVASPTENASEEPKPDEEPHETSSTPVGDQVLTVENNADLAALLNDTTGTLRDDFAAKYIGRTIAFDGSIDIFANHENYDTRWDFLISYGDYSETTQLGPTFKFEDVGRSDLHLEGPDLPDGIAIGDHFHFVAEIVEYDSDRDIFYLDPVSTTPRA